MSIVFLQSEIDRLSIGPVGPAMPTLLMRASMLAILSFSE